MDCCSGHVGEMPEFHFVSPDEHEVPEIKCAIPDSVAQNFECCSAQFMTMERKSIDLTDTGIQSLEVNRREYIRINRDHILDLQYQELENTREKFQSQIESK